MDYEYLEDSKKLIIHKYSLLSVIQLMNKYNIEKLEIYNIPFIATLGDYIINCIDLKYLKLTSNYYLYEPLNYMFSLFHYIIYVDITDFKFESSANNLFFGDENIKYINLQFVKQKIYDDFWNCKKCLYINLENTRYSDDNNIINKNLKSLFSMKCKYYPKNNIAYIPVLKLLIL